MTVYTADGYTHINRTNPASSTASFVVPARDHDGRLCEERHYAKLSLWDQGTMARIEAGKESRCRVDRQYVVIGVNSLKRLVEGLGWTVIVPSEEIDYGPEEWHAQGVNPESNSRVPVRFAVGREKGENFYILFDSRLGDGEEPVSYAELPLTRDQAESLYRSLHVGLMMAGCAEEVE